jgi:hypothetical protein
VKLGRTNQFLGASFLDNAILCAEVFVNGGRPIVRRTATFSFPADVSLETPDAAGQAHWTSQLDSGAMTRGQVMLALSESDEFKASVGNETVVAITYAGMLRREPEKAGYDYWVGYLDSGNSLQAMVGGFPTTPEYRGRFAP